VGAKEGLFLGRACLRGAVGAAFVTARRMDAEENNRGCCKLLDGREKWMRVRWRNWCRKKHPLEKADIYKS
jgi:hypothetical protein